ncbi:hypothetical protein [Alicyclobacillus fastidiosus]|uniref:Uncharacterized protein n=1 Tax=Alicyclobacillus fastidiosus TaxID=392011 RepID=A0ABV5AB11_9BACL|nr:hypothetical protein [Alicyclobacillus fastidiosus]WEH10941.1 hypothetical protein PYS47_06915 [Alicyclobacillus fastidiosus]
MQLPECALFAWFTIIAFSLVPKNLSVLDFVFLYCIVLILTTTTFTTFDIDVHVVTIRKTVTISIATIICRIITIPLLIMMAVDALHFSALRKRKWLIAIGIWMILVGFDWLLAFLKVITYRHLFIWHAVSTCITYFGFIAIAWCLTWWYRRFDRKNVSRA